MMVLPTSPANIRNLLDTTARTPCPRCRAARGRASQYTAVLSGIYGALPGDRLGRFPSYV